VGVSGRKDEPPQSLKMRMRYDRFHQPRGHAATAVVFQNVDVAEIGEGCAIGYDSREADLPFVVEKAEAE